jgi:hypothetical protein
VAVGSGSGAVTPGHIFNWLRASSPSQIDALLDEICHSTRMLRAAISPSEQIKILMVDVSNFFDRNVVRLRLYAPVLNLKGSQMTPPTASPSQNCEG